MPFGDRTGPIGQGPRTGRGLGFCGGNNAPGYTVGGRGFRGGFRGAGFGRGRGFGRGAGFGFGRGAGYGFGRGFGAGFWQDESFAQPKPLTKEEKKRLLMNEKKEIEKELKELEEELKKLK